MRISFTQSGGVVGSTRGCLIDTAELEDDDRMHVEHLVEIAGWTESWERFAAGRDRWQLEISIEGDAESIHVVCDDSCVPEQARPLVSFLKDRATPRKPK